MRFVDGLAVAVLLMVTTGPGCEPTSESSSPQSRIDLQATAPAPSPGKEESITVTILYDNYEHGPDLQTDWGFSCLIEGLEKTILFDTGGNNSVLLSNMEKLSIEPGEIDVVVISHIHGDHVGGLEGFLQRNGRVKVYIPASFPNSWREKITSYGAEYQDVANTMKISENSYTTGEMGTWLKEQSLILHTQQGLIVITGCAHPGIVKIIQRAKQIIPDTPVYLVMGGFHLSGASDSELKSIIKGFRDLGVLKVAPSHCSGDRCRKLFEEEYKEDFIMSGVGKIITL